MAGARGSKRISWAGLYLKGRIEEGLVSRRGLQYCATSRVHSEVGLQEKVHVSVCAEAHCMKVKRSDQAEICRLKKLERQTYTMTHRR